MASNDSEIAYPELIGRRYEPLEVLGQGSFGRVLKCRDQKTGGIVAVKHLIGEQSIFAGKHECSVLKELRCINLEKVNIIRIHHAFNQYSQAFLVFDYFEKDLRKCMDHAFLLKEVRPIATQLFVALKALRELNIIHTDIKPCNIMVVGVHGSVYRLKLIDFGLALSSGGQKTIKGVISTLNYRAPEVIVGLPSDEAVDVWSVGCVLAELFIGKILYPASTEADVLQAIGQSHESDFPPMLEEGIYFSNFIEPSEEGFIFKDCHNTSCPIDSLDELEEFNKPELQGLDLVADVRDREVFVDFIKGVLEIDPDLRLRPGQALEHDFVTLKHVKDYQHCQHVVGFTESMQSMTWM